VYLLLISAKGLAQTSRSWSPQSLAPKAADPEARTHSSARTATPRAEPIWWDCPRIGEAFGGQIIAGAPYARKDESVTKKIVPQATYDQMKVW